MNDDSVPHVLFGLLGVKGFFLSYWNPPTGKGEVVWVKVNIYWLRMGVGGIFGFREMLDDSVAVSPDQELTGSPEQDLHIWLLPPLDASMLMLLPHALRVLRDSPAGTTGFKQPSNLTFFLFGRFLSLFCSCIVALIICLSFLPLLLSSSTSVPPVRS